MSGGSEPTKTRGICPVCGREFTLRRAGLFNSQSWVGAGKLYVPRHGSSPNERCPGSLERPLEIEVRS